MVPDDTSTEPAPKPEGLLDSKLGRIFLIYGLPAVTCLLAGAAIYVSRMKVHQDIHLMAQPEWVAGERAAVRVVAFDGAGRPQQKIAARLRLLDRDGSATEVGSSSIAGLPALDVEVEAPSWPPGDYRLEAVVETPIGAERIVTEVGLRATPPEVELHLPRPPPDRPRPARTMLPLGDFRVELLPHGAGLVPDLSNLLFIRTTDAQGRPVSRELGLKLVDGVLREPLPETDRTDQLGLSVLAVHPQSTVIVIEVSLPGGEDQEVPGAAPGEDGPDAGPAPSPPDAGPEGERPEAGPADAAAPEVEAPARSVAMMVPTTPAQLVLRADQPTPLAGEESQVRVQSLHRSRPLYLDVYRRGRWVAGRTTRLQGNRAQQELPLLAPGLVLLQTYTAPREVGYGYSAHHLYLRAFGQDDEEVLGAIAGELRRREIDSSYLDALVEGRLLSQTKRFNLTAAFLLSRLDEGHYPPPLLVSSSSVRSAELERFQERFKRWISVAIGLLGLVVSTLLAYGFLLAAYRARRQRQLMEQEVGAVEDELYLTSMGRPRGLDRFRVIVQIALMVGVVAIGFILIAVLVSVLDWQG